MTVSGGVQQLWKVPIVKMKANGIARTIRKGLKWVHATWSRSTEVEDVSEV